MKTISILLALMALAFTEVAVAASAIVTTLTGTAQVQTGQASPRVLRQGDEVSQGDTVSTGPASSLVLKFDDGQVAALTPNSRMQITAYQYNPQARTGNILLSLVVGGMRAITGLIGHNQPNNVNFRAATATIGIRGSDGTMVTDGTNVVLTVNTGEFVFTYQGQTFTIPAGQGVFGAAGQVTTGTAQQIFNSLPPNFQNAIGNAQALQNAINRASPGEPRQITPGNQNNQGNTPGQQGQGGQGGGAGGGSPSGQ